MNEDNLIREINKAHIALQDCMKYLEHQSKMNAALHLSDSVMYSPLYMRVAHTITSLQLIIKQAGQKSGGSDE